MIEYSRAIELGIDHPLICAEKVKILFKLKRFKQTSLLFDYVLTLNNFDLFQIQSFHFMNGYALFQINKYALAVDQFNKFISQGGKDVVAYHYKGLALNSLKKYDEAISSFDQSIKLAPSSSQTYLHKAIALKATKKYQEALLAIDKALNNVDVELENYDFLFLYRIKAESLFYIGNYKEALTEINTAIELIDKNTILDNNEYAAIYMCKGAILRLMGKDFDAMIQAKKAIALNPSLGPIENYISK